MFTDGRKSAPQHSLLFILLKALAEVVSEIMLDVRCKLCPEVGVEFEDLEETRHVDALEETVSQSSHISAGLDHIRVGDIARWRLDERDVTAHQVALA